MISPELVDGLVRCPGCGAARWKGDTGALRCFACDKPVPHQDGVLLLDTAPPDPVSVYYDDIGGPHFVGASFAQNMQIALATRAYERHLDAFFPDPVAALVDLGCGDGRFSLWALRRGVRRVVAVDRSLAPLRRLVDTAAQAGLPGLVAIQAPFDGACLAKDAFDAALAIEAFTYLGGDYPKGLGLMRDALRPGGRGVVAEFSRHGRLLADVIAVNLENMREVAERSRRFEKSGSHRLVQRLFEPDELCAECEKTGLAVLKRGGISPVPMLFQYAYTFTSYPLRPPVDDELRRLVERLDDQTSAASDFARNIVLLVEKAR